MNYFLDKKNFLTVIFIFISEVIVFKSEFSWFMFSVLVLFNLFSSWYFLKKASLVTLVSFIPFVQFFLISFISDTYQKQIIILLSAFVFSLFFREKKIEKSYIIIISFFEFIIMTFAVFVFSSLLEGMKITYLAGVYLITFSLFFSSISAVLNLKFILKIRLFYFSVIVSILITELYWFIEKLPFNFITASFIIFVIYYFIWDIVIRYFASSLTKKSLYINIAFLSLILFVVFIIIKIFLT